MLAPGRAVPNIREQSWIPWNHGSSRPGDGSWKEIKLEVNEGSTLMTPFLCLSACFRPNKFGGSRWEQRALLK